MSASSRGWFVVLVLSVVSLPPCIALVPVPIFDMSRRLDAGETSSLARALRDVGFIAVSGLGVDERMIADAISASKTLFDLPFAEKERLVVGNHMLSRGWEMSAEHRRWAESASKTRKDGVHVGSCSLAEQSYMDGILNERFCIGPKNVPEPYADDPEVGPLFFPANVYPPEHMCPGVEVNLRNLYGALEGASSHVLSEVARSLGLAPSHFKPLLKYHSSNLQVANYPSQYEEAPESPIRVKAHADSGTITLLIRQQSTESTDCAGGLEILLDGNWQRVGPLPPGCMLVNLGHIMSFLSGGVYRSTKHRVTNPNPASSTGTPNRRISIAYFQKPDPNGLLIPVHGPSRATQTKNLTRVGIMHKFKHLGQAEASRRYHEIIGSPYLLE